MYTRNTYRLALLLAGLASLRFLAVDAFLPAMPTLANSLQISLVQTQQTLTVYMLGFGIMTLWHGALSDALGRRPVILISLLIFVAASFGCAQANTLGELLLWRTLQGLVSGAGTVIGRTMIRDYFDGIAVQRMMSLVTMLIAMVPAIAPTIGGWLLVRSWQSIFIFMGLCGLLLFVACWFSLAESHPTAQRTPLALRPLLNSYIRIGSTLPFCLIAAALVFNFAGIFVYVPSAPVFLMQHLGLKPQQFLYMFGPIVGCTIFGSWYAGHMAGRRSSHEIIRIGYALMLGATLFNLGYHLLFPPRLLPSVLPLALYTTGVAINIPPMTVMLMDQFPQLRGTASSLQVFFQSMLNALIAGVLSPLVWAHTQTLALSMTGFLLLGFGCYWWYRKRADYTHSLQV